MGSSTGNGVMTQNQDRVQNQSATSSLQEQNRLMNGSSTTNQQGQQAVLQTRTRAEEHKSEVAKFVNELNKVAERNGGIGQQVRVVARAQASSSDEVAEAIKGVEARSGFKTFLVGAGYKNLGVIRSDIVQTRNRLDQLSKELEKVASSTDKATIQKEIDDLKAYQIKLETFVKANESRFSLFGWVVRLFNK